MQNDLISRDALKKLVVEPSMYDINKSDVLSLIEELPTIDAVPVAHGRWEYNPGDNIPYCNRCGMPQDVPTNYCHDCGAKMDGGAA